MNADAAATTETLPLVSTWITPVELATTCWLAGRYPAGRVKMTEFGMVPDCACPAIHSPLGGEATFWYDSGGNPTPRSAQLFWKPGPLLTDCQAAPVSASGTLISALPASSMRSWRRTAVP